MSTHIKTAVFFRTLDNTDVWKEVGFSLGEPVVSYEKEGMIMGLTAERDSSGVTVKDKDGVWNISEDGLLLIRALTVLSPGKLFGNDGIAKPNFVLGIAAIVSSVYSNRMEVFDCAEINNNTQGVNQILSIALDRKKYRGSVTIKTILYLKEKNKEIPGYASSQGTLLGVIDTIDIDMSDKRYLFPVLEIDDPEEPLWWVECKWTDAAEDLFTSENVCIILNRGNKSYKFIDVDGEFLVPAFLADVISSAIQMIVEKAMKNVAEWNKIETESNLINGTVAYMLRYIITTLGWDFSSSEELARSIRTYVYPIVVK